MVYKLSDICTITKGNIGIMKAIPGEFAMITLGEEDKTHNEFQFDAKAVIIPLVSSTGHGHASMKRVKYYEGKFSLGNILCAVIPKDETKVNTKYLHIYLHENRERLLVSLMKGAANVSLPIKRLDNVEVIVPNMKRQLEIVELEKIISEKNDLLINKFSNQSQLLSQLRQSILQEAIQGKLTEKWRSENKNTEPASELLKRIKSEKEKTAKKGKKTELPEITANETPFELPQGWVWTILDVVADFKNGKAHEQFIDPNGNYILINSKFVSTNGEVIKNTNNLLLPMFKDEIAMVMSDVPSGRALARCFLIDENDKYSLNQRIGGLTCLEGIDPKYLVLVLDRNQHYLNFDDGKKQTNLTKNEILTCPIPLPPLSEQHAIVAQVEVLLDKCNALQAEIESLSTHSKTLLKALFNETFATETV